MILCASDCIPCCDFCVYAIHDEWDDPNGEQIIGGPIGCKRWDDQEHQDIAESCGYCLDYHCFRAAEDIDFYCVECGERIIGAQVFSLCPTCGHMTYMPYDEYRANLTREEWKNTYKWKCCNCGKWHWDISGPNYKCDCGSTLFEDKIGESV